MSENRVIRTAFLISFTGHCLLLGTLGFNLHLPYQDEKPDEIMINLEVEKPALLPKIDTMGEEKKIKEVKEEPNQQESNQRLQAEEVTAQERLEEKIRAINPEEEAMLRYQDMVKQRIEKVRSYPFWAKRQGIEGASSIAFILLPNGKVRDVKIILSSVFDVLDMEAISTVNRASPFEPIPENFDCSSLVMEVTLVFKIK